MAILVGNIDGAHILHKEFGFSLAEKDDQGVTALHIAAWAGDIQAMVLLLHHGNAQGIAMEQDGYGRTPLHYAVMRRQATAVKLLLDSATLQQASSSLTGGRCTAFERGLAKHAKASKHNRGRTGVPIRCMVTLEDSFGMSSLDYARTFPASPHIVSIIEQHPAMVGIDTSTTTSTRSTSANAAASVVAVDGSGEGHASVVAVDGSGEGHASVVAVDGSGEGHASVVAVDGSGEGHASVVAVDGSGEGHASVVAVDGSGEGHASVVAVDGSGEGHASVVAVDGSGEGHASVVAVDGSGEGHASVVAVDGSGEGHASVVAVDGSGEGHASVVAVDGSGEGHASVVAVDGSGEGQRQDWPHPIMQNRHLLQLVLKKVPENSRTSYVDDSTLLKQSTRRSNPASSQASTDRGGSGSTVSMKVTGEASPSTSSSNPQNQPVHSSKGQNPSMTAPAGRCAAGVVLGDWTFPMDLLPESIAPAQSSLCHETAAALRNVAALQGHLFAQPDRATDEAVRAELAKRLLAPAPAAAAAASSAANKPASTDVPRLNILPPSRGLPPSDFSSYASWARVPIVDSQSLLAPEFIGRYFSAQRPVLLSNQPTMGSSIWLHWTKSDFVERFGRMRLRLIEDDNKHYLGESILPSDAGEGEQPGQSKQDSGIRTAGTGASGSAASAGRVVTLVDYVRRFMPSPAITHGNASNPGPLEGPDSAPAPAPALSFAAPPIAYSASALQQLPDEWRDMLDPPELLDLCSQAMYGKREPLKLYMAARHAVVPLHAHNASWSLLLSGVKAWYLLAPGDAVRLHQEGVLDDVLWNRSDKGADRSEQAVNYSSSETVSSVSTLQRAGAGATNSSSAAADNRTEEKGWYSTFFLKLLPELRRSQVLVEVVQYPGEVLFVPHGWFHATRSLADSVSLSQEVCTALHSDQRLPPLGPIIYGVEEPRRGLGMYKTHRRTNDKPGVQLEKAPEPGIFPIFDNPSST